MPERGIYHDGTGAVRYAGNRKPSDPQGLVWQRVDDLPKIADLRHHRWDGTNLVRKAQAEIDAIEAADLESEDTEFFEDRRLRAAVMAIVKAVNQRLPASQRITRQELVDLYRAELGT